MMNGRRQESEDRIGLGRETDDRWGRRVGSEDGLKDKSQRTETYLSQHLPDTPPSDARSSQHAALADLALYCQSLLGCLETLGATVVFREL